MQNQRASRPCISKPLIRLQAALYVRIRKPSAFQRKKAGLVWCAAHRPSRTKELAYSMMTEALMCQFEVDLYSPELQHLIPTLAATHSIFALTK